VTTARSAEWGLRYQELTAEAGQAYARALGRYQELLDRVADGQLTPADVQKKLLESYQQQSGAATRDLVALSVGLVAGLIDTEARYREALLDGLLPPDGPRTPPPSPDGLDASNWFHVLAAYASQQSARAAGRQQALIDRVASGAVSTAEVRERARRFVEAQAPAFLNDVMDLGLTFVGRLQRSSAGLAERLYDHVLGPAAQRSSHAPPPLEPPTTLELRGPLGAVLTAEVVVENTRAVPADIECRPSDVASRARGTRFRSGLEIVPARFTLAPGEQREVTLRLPLDPAQFAAGSDYVASVGVLRPDEREMIVHLLVHTDAAAAPPPVAEAG
jgi:hypothetical protein